MTEVIATATSANINRIVFIFMLFRRNLSPQVEQQIRRGRFDAELANHPDDLSAMQRGMIGDVLHLIDEAH